MTDKEIFRETPLWAGWTLCQYWPAEIILKHAKRKRGIYIKAPWYLRSVNTRWEAADGKFISARRINKPYPNRLTFTISEWTEARRYVRRFTYTTRYGEMQTATLTAFRERTRHVMHALRWIPFCGADEDGLTIEFDAEMGSERGSWKGGVIGASVTMLRHETVSDAIDRFLSDAQKSHRWDR